MKNRWMTAMVLCVIAFYSFLVFSGLTAHRGAEGDEASLQAKETLQTLKHREDAARQNLAKQPELMNTLSLAFLSLLFWGVFLDVRFLIRRSRTRGLPALAGPVAWGGRDVFHAIMFLLFMEAFVFLIHDLFRAMMGLGADPPDTVLLAASFLRDLVVAAFVWMLVHSGYGQGARELGLRPENSFRHIRAGVLGYVAVVPLLILTFAVLAVLMQLFSWQPQPQAVVQIYLKPATEPFLIPLTIFVALLGPVMEEVFFRGFVHAGLRRRFGVWGAACLSASAFAALHMNWAAFAPIFLLGLFLALLYESTGSLIPSITAHVLHNVIMVLMTLGFKHLSS